MLDRRLLFRLISERALLPSRDARMGIPPMRIGFAAQ
jgi:hypothetical protein